MSLSRLKNSAKIDRPSDQPIRSEKVEGGIFPGAVPEAI
jgi:hypothetical protein